MTAPLREQMLAGSVGDAESPVRSESSARVLGYGFAAALVALLAYVTLPAGNDGAVAYDTATYVRMARGLFTPGEPIGFRYLGDAAAAHRLQTTFPLGYPLCIALVSAAKIDPFLAAALVSFLAFVAAALGVYAFSVSRLPSSHAFLVALLFVVSRVALGAGRQAMSEMPAIAAFVASLCLLAVAERSEGARAARFAFFAGVAGGAVVWFRYGMLCFVPAFGLGAASCWRRGQSRRAVAVAATSMVASLAALFAINIRLGGSPFGPYRPPAVDGPVRHAKYLVNHVVALVFGWLGNRENPATVGVSLLLFAALVAYAALTFARVLRDARCEVSDRVAQAFFVLYPLAILAAECRFHIDPIDSRLLAPLVPALALAVFVPAVRDAASPAVSALRRSAASALLIAFAAGQCLAMASDRTSPLLRGESTVEGKAPPAPERVEVARSVGDGVLLTNDKVLLASFDFRLGYFVGDDRHWLPSVLTRSTLESVKERAGAAFVYLRYDHPPFDPAPLGALAVELYRGGASRCGTPGGVQDFALVSDDGKGMLFRWTGAPIGANDPLTVD